MRWERWERFLRNRIQKKSRVSDPSLHHGTCVTHVPWCMSGSLTHGGGENIPGACAILHICQEAHCLHSIPRVEAPIPFSSWYCLKCWFGADRQQAITWINAAKIFYAPPGVNGLQKQSIRWARCSLFRWLDKDTKYGAGRINTININFRVYPSSLNLYLPMPQ